MNDKGFVSFPNVSIGNPFLIKYLREALNNSSLLISNS